jgi:hypothetical protein
MSKSDMENDSGVAIDCSAPDSRYVSRLTELVPGAIPKGLLSIAQYLMRLNKLPSIGATAAINVFLTNNAVQVDMFNPIFKRMESDAAYDHIQKELQAHKNDKIYKKIVTDISKLDAKTLNVEIVHALEYYRLCMDSWKKYNAISMELFKYLDNFCKYMASTGVASFSDHSSVRSPAISRHAEPAADSTYSFVTAGSNSQPNIPHMDALNYFDTVVLPQLWRRILSPTKSLMLKGRGRATETDGERERFRKCLRSFGGSLVALLHARNRFGPLPPSGIQLMQFLEHELGPAPPIVQDTPFAEALRDYIAIFDDAYCAVGGPVATQHLRRFGHKLRCAVTGTEKHVCLEFDALFAGSLRDDLQRTLALLENASPIGGARLRRRSTIRASRRRRVPRKYPSRRRR